MTIHLRPTNDLAPRVLLPGDPGRALTLAQHLLDSPLMCNHHRGLWGYTGTAADGAPLTIQSTGMGGPSAAIVLEELVDLGVTHAIRVGTCGALAPHLALGQVIVAESIVPADGTSRALGAGDVVFPDPNLTQALVCHGLLAQRIVSTDLFYDPTDREPDWIARGATAVEMEGAALAHVGQRRGVAVGIALIVSDTGLTSGRTRIDDDALATATERLGDAAYSAFGAALTPSA